MTYFLANGKESVPSSIAVTTTASSNLAGNPETISYNGWLLYGVIAAKVYKYDTGSGLYRVLCPKNGVDVTLVCTDTGQILGSDTPPAYSNTGSVAVDGPVIATDLGLLSNPTAVCDSLHGGHLNYIAGGPGVKDTVQMCAKDAGDTYAWRAVY